MELFHGEVVKIGTPATISDVIAMMFKRGCFYEKGRGVVKRVKHIDGEAFYEVEVIKSIGSAGMSWIFVHRLIWEY